MATQLKLTHLDKVFWPQEGYTKGDVVNYYRQITPYILPYLKNRPEALNRHPHGIAKKNFFQKNVKGLVPRWIKTYKNYLVCENQNTLLYVVNLGCMEINPWNSTTKHPTKPDFLIIDLDPEGVPFSAVIETAQVVRQVLDEVGARGFCKTSGQRGLHIYVPLGAKYDYKVVRDFAHQVVQEVNRRLPEITSLERRPSKRRHRVYLDYLQNSIGQTLAAPYSLRPKPGAPVSTPLEWREVKPGLDPKKFNLKTIFPRLKQKGDLFRPVLGRGINLKQALRRLTALH